MSSVIIVLNFIKNWFVIIIAKLLSLIYDMLFSCVLTKACHLTFLNHVGSKFYKVTNMLDVGIATGDPLKSII